MVLSPFHRILASQIIWIFVKQNTMAILGVCILKINYLMKRGISKRCVLSERSEFTQTARQLCLAVVFHIVFSSKSMALDILASW